MTAQTTGFRHVKGLDGVYANLQLLPTAMEQQLMRPAMRAGGTVMRDEVRALIPIAAPSKENEIKYGSYPGALRDSVRVGVPAPKGGRIVAYVRMGNAKAWYWRFFEFGTAAHWIVAKAGSAIELGGKLFERVWHPGTQPHPLMRQAFDSQAGPATVAVGQYLQQKFTTLKLRAYGTRASGEIVDDS